MATFGEESDGGSFSTLYLHTLSREYMYCVADAPDSNGTLDKISIHTDGLWGHSISVQCAIFEYVDDDPNIMGKCMGITESKVISEGTTNTTVDFEFSEPKVSLVQGTKYCLVVAPSSNHTGGNNVCRISDGNTELDKCYDWSNTGITLVSGTSYTSEQELGGTVYIYGTYTPTGEPPGTYGNWTRFKSPIGSEEGWSWASGQFKSDSYQSMCKSSLSDTTWFWNNLTSSATYYYPSGDVTGWAWHSGSAGAWEE